ncbi:hypothetical protein SRABI27_01669 [Pedobacter sp. Bi27]|uniref:hypothetical protein n=1 Tax=unclassified Pedobacter TaxID=2628915 RepID=UPI001DF960FF|nr:MULTISPECIES: hypothetical protein [unclassified Pedobacter]CAH0173880.1 hypothetical protein SRABI36_01331 [Pedobacter sp. Bi36]CAH0198006.1 hypothetical protein SRABI27_01669 [Pedobacter sp. Bi27]CAH0229709.1 hypothetical protein SRABI126_02424 [Pedobacter sp. Bi126]
MKTSNKLLISLAALLIVIPIVVVAINIKLNYRERGIEDTYFGTQEINNEAFDQKSKGRITIPLQTPFKAIQIKDAKRFSVQLYVKEDKRYGLKVPEKFKNDLKFEVDANGVLQITVKNQTNDNDAEKIVLVIYCPNINEASVTNSNIFEFSAHSDSIKLNVDHSEMLFLTGDITYNDTKGKVTSIINPTKIGKLYLNLNKTKFSGVINAFKDLYVTANNSEIEIGNIDDNKEFPFDNLNIKTTDTSSVKLQNVKVKTFTGDFSDATTLQIPTPLLKQLFKK